MAKKHKKKNQIFLIKKMIEQAEESVATAKSLLMKMGNGDKNQKIYIDSIDTNSNKINTSEVGEIIEGEFDGEKMIGPQQKEYTVPANYASKSKLIKGDKLKLTVSHDGSFIFKQIGPAERKRIRGVLKQTVDNDFIADVNGKNYKVLYASVTYFKAEPGDEVILLVPKFHSSETGAIENIIKK